MYDRTLKNVVALTFIVGHIALVFQIGALWYLDNAFDFSEVLDACLIVTPMIAAYASGMVRYVFFAPANVSRGPKRSPTFVTATALVVSAFFFVLAMMAIAKSNGKITFESYKRALAGIDTVFAIYLSQLVASLFGAEVGSAHAHPEAPPPALVPPSPVAATAPGAASGGADHGVI